MGGDWSVRFSRHARRSAHRWTLQELAECASMSRSTFPLRFKQTVGTSPMEYLARWRMLLAGDKLTNSSDPISVVSLSQDLEHPA